MASKQFVIFSIGEEEFGIDITKVNIIEKPMNIYKVPNTPIFVEGLINLRGKVHTVFNLRKRFNMEDRSVDDNTKIIIVNTQTSTVGLIVDSVHEILKVVDENIENALGSLGEIRNRYVSSIVKTDKRMILILDIDSVLSLSEKAV